MRSRVGMWLIGTTAALALGAAGCSRDTAATQTTEQTPVAVEVAQARSDTLVSAVDVTGTLSAKRAADLKSEVNGVVAELLIREWAPVRRGAVLARLDPTDAEATLAAAKAGVLQARVGEDRARREQERAVRLKQVGLITQQQLDDAGTALQAAEATTAAAEAQLVLAQTHLEKTTIRAPFDGVVEYRGIDVGDRVENMGGGSMFRIVDPKLLELVAMVPSTRMAGLAVGQALEFSTDSYPGRTFTGTVSFINPTVDASSRSVRIVVDVPNATGELRGGQFVTGRILTGERPDVLVIPRTALQTWDVEAGTGVVFVVEDATAQRRKVRVGVTVGDVVEITDGLAAGASVVTRGGFNLHDGDRVTVADTTPSA